MLQNVLIMASSGIVLFSMEHANAVAQVLVSTIAISDILSDTHCNYPLRCQEAQEFTKHALVFYILSFISVMLATYFVVAVAIAIIVIIVSLCLD